MRMDKLTSKFQLALADAQSLAIGRESQFIEPAHLLVALLDQQGGTARHLLVKAGANVNLLRSKLGEAIDQLPKVEGAAGEVREDRHRLGGQRRWRRRLNSGSAMAAIPLPSLTHHALPCRSPVMASGSPTHEDLSFPCSYAASDSRVKYCFLMISWAIR